ncbi:MAG: TIGR02099 family protein [Hydrogenophaga sp.]|uniref:YhdP family protein n=1 Tax=Hydrogenophaga sp. TaxID=1904254 RepID=UPI001D552692|nr:YhdP family protein [Hydrogenophaga sp.]MBX3608421.1 TIGR02099 family protein [Hydrogenophaga sp.]
MMRSRPHRGSSDAGSASAGRGLRLWARGLRVLLWLLAGLWGIFILSWFVLQAWIVPRIENWRPELQRWASEAVGVEVRIGAIRAVKAADRVLPPLVPSFEFDQVQLLDASGGEALRLPLVKASVSVASLWRGAFESVRIDQPVLDVRRRSDGHIEVAGIDVTSGADGDGSAARWFFDQSSIEIRGGAVRWHDELRDLPPLALSQLDVIVRNGARSHQLRLDATPPAQWGDRFTLRAQLSEPLLRLPTAAPDANPWDDWSGELFAGFERVDVAQLRQRVDLSEWGVQVRSGQGALRAWARVRDGMVDGLTLDAALSDVDLQLGADLPAMALQYVNGRLEASRSASGWQASTDRLAFRTTEGLDWVGAQVAIEHLYARERQGPRTAVKAQGVELATLSALAERLPLPAEARGWLTRLQPRGRLEALDLLWQARGSGPLAERVVARAKGRVTGLVLKGEPSGRMSISGRFPLPGRPGIEGGNIDFDLDQNGGSAQVALRDGVLDFPDVFEQSRIAFDRFDARFRWRIDGEQVKVDLDDASFANADTEGSARGSWHTADPGKSSSHARFPGVLDLTGQLTRANGTAVHRYLPLVVNEHARQYVRDAVLAGTSRQASVRIQGDLWDMPFDQPQNADGVFRIAAQLEGVDFDHLPAFLPRPGDLPWPGVRGATARFELDRGAMHVSDVAGGLANAAGVRIEQGSVTIADLAHAPVVKVGLKASGPAAALLGHVQRTPLNVWTAGALSEAVASGPASVDLSLELPLEDLPKSQVRGQVHLDGTDLRIAPSSPLLGKTRGTLSFTEAGFAFTGARAQVYGGELLFDGSLRPDADGRALVQFRGQGVATAAGLRDGLRDGPGAKAAPWLARLSGSTAYTAQLGFRGPVPDLRITSSLQGMGLDLPAPLNKAPEAIWPMRWDSALQAASGGRAAQQRVSLTVGPSTAQVIDLLLERPLEGSGPARGSVAVGLPVGERDRLPDQGVVLQARVGELDVDAWQRLLSQSSGADAAMDALMPSRVSLQADGLVVEGRRFHRLLLGASRLGSVWRASVDADELNGYVEFRPASGSGAGSVYARLARLSLSPTAPREVDRLLQQPSSVPALDIAVDELRWGERSLGRVEIDAVNRGGPTRVGEWRLNALRATLPEAQLTASGNWAPVGAQSDGPTAAAQRRTALQFKLALQDSGALLERFGATGLVRGGRGRLEGTIGWLGTPMSFDHASLSGQLHLDLERGQFLKAEPGAGRLLGVLSLQALPRRLTLDFRDVFSEGFAFDFVRGDAAIESGVVSTNNLQMKGVNAAVLLEGSADLGQETQDLKVVVVPELNAGTASLIASAINPAVGIGTFLAQFLLRQPLQSAATQEFRVTGKWGDPQVDKVARSAPAPAQSPTL